MKSSYSAGLLGGITLVGIFLIIIFSTNIFNYRIVIEKDRQNQTKIESELKRQIYEELKRDKIVLTPQEYTNNIVNYYNTAFLILSAMLIVFSFISYFHLKFLSDEHLRKRMKSEEFQEIIKQSIFGRAEEKFLKKEYEDKIRQDMIKISERIENLELIVELEDDEEETGEIL
ncbi:hypothetical protein [uncultured Draconibacterium sp.]|uniref:hypothetical protein n=1 Tax=uncultured Draconibacterium sp. TaxID=1573823 RepID=UPI0032180D7C